MTNSKEYQREHLRELNRNYRETRRNGKCKPYKRHFSPITQHELFLKGLKHCRICREIKSLFEFYKSSCAKDGYRSECISCKNKEHGKYQKRNIKRLSNYMREYMRKYAKRKRQENPEFIMIGNKKVKKRTRPYAEQVRWTEDEIKLLKLLYPKNGITGVREHLNKTDKAIYRKANRLGLRRVR